MKRNIFLVFIVIVAFAAVPASAQIGNLTKKITEKAKQEQTQKPAAEKARAPQPDHGTATRGAGYKDSDFLFMGRNDMEGEKIAEMRACVVGASDQGPPPVSKAFVAWITNISEVAALRSFNSSTCQVVAFRIDEHPAYKYKNIDTLTETTQGNSIYNVIAGKLTLIRKIDASQFLIVVVPDHNKPGLKLADLRMCGYPDTIKLFRRKVNSVANCHDQKQKLYVFEKYQRYPGPMQNGSVIFDAAEFNQLNKQGKFKGLVIYKLVAEELVPYK